MGAVYDEGSSLEMAQVCDGGGCLTWGPSELKLAMLIQMMP